jgi:hypothetical protein
MRLYLVEELPNTWALRAQRASQEAHGLRPDRRAVLFGDGTKGLVDFVGDVADVEGGHTGMLPIR